MPHGPSPGLTGQRSIAWVYKFAVITRVQRFAMEFHIVFKIKLGGVVYYNRDHIKIKYCRLRKLLIWNCSYQDFSLTNSDVRSTGWRITGVNLCLPSLMSAVGWSFFPSIINRYLGGT